MRWRILQYADLTEDPERAIKKIIKDLQLEEKAFQKLKDLLPLLKNSTAKVASDQKAIQENDQESNLINLLPSEVEFKSAITMRKKSIKKSKQLIIYVAILSIILLSLLLSVEIDTPKWMIIVGSLSINLLSIYPFGNMKKGERVLDLLKMLELKRDRLIRIINKLIEKNNNTIADFNHEFDNFIAM